MSGPNAADVAANWGLRCPACGDCEAIDIAATVWVRLCPDGTDPVLACNGDHEWTGDCAAHCHACGFHGKVRTFDTAAQDVSRRSKEDATN